MIAGDVSVCCLFSAPPWAQYIESTPELYGPIDAQHVVSKLIYIKFYFYNNNKKTCVSDKLFFFVSDSKLRILVLILVLIHISL